MNTWLKIYLIAFCGSTGITLLLTPVFRRLAKKFDLMDVPQANHKGHRQATPLLGGMALFCGWFSAILAGALVLHYGLIPQFTAALDAHLPGFIHVSKRLVCIIIGAAAAVLLGLWDDKYALKAAPKFLGQFFIAVFAVWFGGVRLKLFPGIPLLSLPLSVFWLMLLMNAINFFDNMDGLAVGTITIAMAFFAVIAALNKQYFVTILAITSCGAGVGFWFYNAAPASIFMGDSGSHFLGYLAGVISAGVTFFDKSYSLSRFPMLMPLFILAIPLFDTLMVILIRFHNHRPFWIGDHNHISHRFVRMGLSRPVSVLLIHILCLTIGLGILPVFWGEFKTACILILQAVLLLLVISIIQFKLSERPDAAEKPLVPPEKPTGRHR